MPLFNPTPLPFPSLPTTRLETLISNQPTNHPTPHIQVALDQTAPISSTLTFAPFLSAGGSIVSDPSYPIQVDAALEHGADYITLSRDGRYVKLDVQSLARDARTGGLLRFTYTGKVAMGGAAGKVLRGEAGAATTGFGDACEFLGSFSPACFLVCKSVSE